MSELIDHLLAKAREAQKVIEFWPQEKVDEMILAVGWEAYKRETAETVARLAVEETGLGVYEDKVLKHQKKTIGVLRDLQGEKTVGVIERVPEKGLVKIAKPMGVIGAITPMTNSSSTMPCNGLMILKARNAVIFAPHPRAKKTCAVTCEEMRKGLAKVGAPLDLVQYIEEPSIELTQELMSKVDLVLATGGAGVVKPAYSSGKPAYGVGAGNATVVVDETADLPVTAAKICKGKIFDNATSCSAENNIVIQESIFDDLLEELKKTGGHLVTGEDRAKLKAAMWPDGVHLSGKIVCKSVKFIAEEAGIHVPDGTKFIMVLGEHIGPEDMFSAEKLSPVLTLWKYKTFDQAVQMVIDITGFSGYGHSCGIHSVNEEHILELATKAKVSRMMVRQAQSVGNSGDWENGMPFSMSLGCGTWGGNITSENITVKHFLNVTWVSYPIPAEIPDPEVIFAPHFAKYGK
ncbi:MAG TPA: aldehyde dehydrogenase family protein [Anaerolineaceae bacterium]|jgi:sulfoacetaldehyde dehydrogenase|nr:aldehyde dehydrogenase family protein [Anaerolineaceae bacterium]NMC18173.1 aldehyde dehydrogenase family protein [Chloroflexota bacterium]HNS07423.1 aldehyde dehydrogenase family protein [Anaerolineaceae bacterium]HNW13232.1 aldehyde dehydrogenase family protein [Anaerolineaceae bacterium]HOE01793.1 aldehyde dehydrogenase family protein [Anaerolineaceae bacterium]